MQINLKSSSDDFAYYIFWQAHLCGILHNPSLPNLGPSNHSQFTKNKYVTFYNTNIKCKVKDDIALQIMIVLNIWGEGSMTKINLTSRFTNTHGFMKVEIINLKETLLEK